EIDEAPLQILPRDDRALPIAALRLGLIAAEENVAPRVPDAELLDDPRFVGRLRRRQASGGINPGFHPTIVRDPAPGCNCGPARQRLVRRTAAAPPGRMEAAGAAVVIERSAMLPRPVRLLAPVLLAALLIAPARAGDP